MVPPADGIDIFREDKPSRYAILHEMESGIKEQMESVMQQRASGYQKILKKIKWL